MHFMLRVRLAGCVSMARTAIALVAISAFGCSARTPTAPTKTASKAGPPSSEPIIGSRAFVTPSMVLPDLPLGLAPQGVEPDGSRRLLTMQMRIIEHPDGAIERASSLLPSGYGRLLSVELPARLGGGFVFVSSSESTAQMWRAARWLAPLEPLASTNLPIYEVLAGFDRIYVRHERVGPLVGIDPDKGDYADVGNLPMPTRIGPAVFADGWRAVVVADIRGPVATFDAGGSWFPLGIRSPVQKLELAGDSIVIQTRDDRFALSAQGALSSIGSAPAANSANVDERAKPPRRPDRPLGRRPLRLAIERGIPLGPDQALVAHHGAIASVDIRTGATLERFPHAYPDSYTECSAIRLGTGLGFVCGENHGATTVFQYEPPGRVQPVMHWPEPRAIIPNGNGAVIARAPCPGKPTAPGLTQYCLRDTAGHTREIRFKGDLGAERIAVMSDATVAVLIAPRPGTEARLVLLKGDKPFVRALDFSNVPRTVSDLAHRGLWMNGLVELEPGVLGVWVEAGGPIVGLKIDAQGKVTAGPVQKALADATDVVVSGRFGIVWMRAGKGRETTDGGLTWKDFETPTSTLASLTETRACSAVGCVVAGWMRVGWGPARDEDDLEPARKPPSRTQASRGTRGLSLQCESTGRSSAPPIVPTQPAYRAGYGYGYGYGPTVVSPGRFANARWQPFGSQAPPPLPADQEGISGGRDYGDVRTGDFRYRIYAWGPKSSDWTRSGRWMLRFDDPYDPVGPPRSTAPSVSPWPDMAAASMAMAMRTDVLFDPEGRNGVYGWCSMPRQCKLTAFAIGEPPLVFTTSDPNGMPSVMSAVRAGESWYLLTSPVNSEMDLWIVSPSGQARRARTFPRTTPDYGSNDPVTLVRRARAAGVGILTYTRGSRSTVPEWLVLPLDPATGELLDAVRLGSTDLSSAAPTACSPEQDGWLVEAPMTWAPALRVGTQTLGVGTRARMRLDPGRACLEGFSVRARSSELGLAKRKLNAAALPAGAIPVSVWDMDQNRKYELSCAVSTPP